MKAIIVNQIRQKIWSIAGGQGQHADDLSVSIRDAAFSDRPKSWSRILNNYHQPTLEEAATIAEILNTSIEELFEFTPPTKILNRHENTGI